MTGTFRAAERAVPRHAGSMLAVLVSAMFMGQFDFTAVNVAAPSLESDLRAGPAALELIVGGYAFSYAGGLITGGRLGDIYGHRRLFVAGMAAFAVASVLCGLAASPAQLVIARLLQGLTAALMIPQILAMITATYPPERRPRALAWYAAAAGLGTIAGQVAGGLLVEADIAALGWRVIFLVNAPIGVVAIPLALRLLPAGGGTRRAGLDPLGAMGIAMVLALVLVPLGLGHGQGWPAWTWACLAGAVPCAAVVVWQQRALARRGGDPVLDLSLLANRPFVIGVATGIAFLAFYASYLFTLALLLQRGLGLGPAAAGLAFAPGGVTFAISSLGGRRLIARYGLRVVLAGATVSAGTLALLAAGVQVEGEDLGPGWIALATAVIGFGNGAVFPSLVGVALVRIQPAQAGAASGILTTAQQFAMSAGIAVVGAVFFGVAGAHPAAGDFADAMRWSLALDVCLLLIVMILVWEIKRMSVRGGRPWSA